MGRYGRLFWLVGVSVLRREKRRWDQRNRERENGTLLRSNTERVLL